MQRERERDVCIRQDSFLHGRSFPTGGSSWKCSKRSNRMDEGAARARSRPTKTRIPRRPVYPSLFLLRWVDVATKRRKRKEKRKKGMATRRERRWDLPAPVPRLPSFDPMIRISRRVVRVYTRTRLFRSVHVRVCACRGITRTQTYIYIYIKRTYKETRSRSKIYISAYERRSKWLLTGYIRLIGIYTIQVHFARKQCTRSVGWHAMPTGVAFSEVRCA